jgi:putative transposase
MALEHRGSPPAPRAAGDAMRQRPFGEIGGTTFHVVNRAIEGQLLFRDFGAYLAYMRLLERTLGCVPVDMFGFCLMPNHVHFLLRPSGERDLVTFMQRLTSQHAMGLRRWTGTKGRGAVYQSRYWASRVHNELYFCRVARYVERNPVRARLVDRAEEWLWSSASPIPMVQGINLAEWPVPRPAHWRSYIDGVEPPDDLAYIRQQTLNRLPIGERLEAETGPASPAPLVVVSSERK